MRILLTVSEIKEPISFSDRSDLEAILLTIDIWMDMETMMMGVNARVTNAIFQQWIMAISKEMEMVVALRQIIATIPVTIL